jgi:hypothetical protein
MCGTFLGTKTSRARREYGCEACNTPIPAGHLYITSAEVDGRDFISGKWHVECREQFDSWLSTYGDDCMDPWMTWEDGMPPEIRWRYVPGPYEREAGE